MSPIDVDGMANSVDPDQTAPLFAQAYLDHYGIAPVVQWGREEISRLPIQVVTFITPRPATVSPHSPPNLDPGVKRHKDDKIAQELKVENCF